MDYLLNVWKGSKKWLCILVLLLVTCSTPAYAEEDQALTGASTLGEIFGYISQFHLKQPDAQKLTEASIKGMLDELGDPYTVYFSPGELDAFSDELNGDFEGIGAEMELQDGLPYLVRVLHNSPAQQAGLKTGDIIVMVDGHSVAGKPLYEIVSQLRGSKGTKVKVTVRRAGQQDFNVEITRNTVDMPTVYDKVFDGGIGYIAVDSFGMETGEEFGNALIQLQQGGIKSLIIDLRNNGGGYVDAATEMAAYLMGPDQTVFITVDRNKRQDPYNTDLDLETILKPGMPVVVLINGETASASEILAGALQDYGRATLVGTVSYGKGTVQDIIPLENGGALKMTTASYLTPKGRPIDGIGLQPDHLVSTPELQIPVARKLLQLGPTELQFSQGTKVTINGESFNAPAVCQEGQTWYVPLRFTLEAMGYQVKWEGNAVQIKGKGTPWQKLQIPLKTKGGLSYLAAQNLSNLGAVVQLQDNKLIIKTK